MKKMLYLITTISILCCIKLEYENYYPEFDQLATYHEEYKDGGSRKWRRPIYRDRMSDAIMQGQNFYPSLWIYGVPLYLTTIISAVIALFCFSKLKTNAEKILVVGCFLISVSILILIINQGVLIAALELG